LLIDDEEDERANWEEASALWGVDQVKESVSVAENWLANIGHRIKGPSMANIIKFFEDVPSDVKALVFNALEESISNRSRLSKEQSTAIATEVRRIAEGIYSLCGEQGDACKEAEQERFDVAVVASVFPLGQLQEAICTLQDMKTKLNCSKEGPTKDNLLALVETFPDESQVHFDTVAPLLHVKRPLEPKEERSILDALLQSTEEVQKFYEEQSGAAAGSGSKASEQSSDAAGSGSKPSGSGIKTPEQSSVASGTGSKAPASGSAKIAASGSAGKTTSGSSPGKAT